MANSAELPCGSKILSKSLYLARFSRYRHLSAEIPCGSKISSKSLYLARFSRYSIFVKKKICHAHNGVAWLILGVANFF